MADYKKRVDEQLELHGENILINGVTPALGCFMLADLTRLNTYFNSYEQSGMTKPALTLQTSADAVIAVDDTIVRDGRTYTVSRLAKQRIDGNVVMQTAVLT